VIDGISAANGWPDDHPDRAALIERVLRPQPLQAFSPAVFGDGGDRPVTAVPSYDRRLVAGARRLQARLRRGEQAAEPKPLLTGALPETGERVVSVDRLVSFWQEPLRGLLSGRLDLDLQDDDEDVPEREPVALSRLDEYRMGSLLVEWERLGVTEADMRALAMGTGMLPAGPQGGGLAIRLRQIATQLQQESAACGADGPPASRYVDVTVGDLRVMGTVDRIWPTARIEARFGSLQPKHLLAAWIRHLVLQAAEPSARPTYVIGRKGDDILPPVMLPAIPQAVAFERLTVLLQGWQLGQTRPLLFFPKTSLAYVEAYRKAVEKGEGDPAAVARTKVWGTWTGFFNGRISPHSEAQSVYVQHLLGSGIHAVWDPDFEVPGYAEALPAFAELARLVWMPYLEDGNGTV
jgi:exodeoxyribonuclease V gamma subunit